MHGFARASSQINEMLHTFLCYRPERGTGVRYTYHFMDLSFESLEPLYLCFLYKHVILYFEQDVKKDPTGFRISENFIHTFLKVNNLLPIVSDTRSKITIPKGYGCSNESFIKCRKNSRYSILVSVLEHFRNSLAHGRFNLRMLNGEVYINLQDYSTQDKCVTMVAQMPFSKLYCLIDYMKAQKNK